MAKGKYDEWRTEEGLTRLRGWARDGYTQEQISDCIGISRSTLNVWISRYSDIADALKKGRDVADREIEDSLFKKAKGFRTEVKKPIKLKKIIFDEVTGKKIEESEVIEYATEEVYIPPDTVAMIFWLKNRKPEQWREKPAEVQESTTEAAGVIEIPMVEASNE